MAMIEQKSVIYKGTDTGDVIKVYPETTSDQVKTKNGTSDLETDLNAITESIHDTTYSISRSGDNLVLTDSEGHEDSEAINNFSELTVGNWKIETGTDSGGEDVIEISLVPTAGA